MVQEERREGMTEEEGHTEAKGEDNGKMSPDRSGAVTMTPRPQETAGLLPPLQCSPEPPNLLPGHPGGKFSDKAQVSRTKPSSQSPAICSDGTAGDGPAGDGPAGDGTAGDGPAGEGTAGDGPAGESPAGEGTAGDGRAGDGPAGDGTAIDGRPPSQPGPLATVLSAPSPCCSLLPERPVEVVLGEDHQPGSPESLMSRKALQPEPPSDTPRRGSAPPGAAGSGRPRKRAMPPLLSLPPPPGPSPAPEASRHGSRQNPARPETKHGPSAE